MKFELDIDEQHYEKLLKEKLALAPKYGAKLPNVRQPDKPVQNLIIAIEGTKLMVDNGQFEKIKQHIINFVKQTDPTDGKITFKLDVIVFHSYTSPPIKFISMQ